MKNTLFILLFISLIVSGCGSSNGGGQGINLFTIDQDKELGAQVATEIASDSKTYPILDANKYASVYQYVNNIRDKILNAGNVTHRNDFKWEVKIIHNDTTVNAFCAPGGYIYVYTGILKFLDSEDQLAGVLGHEIAHADMRHSTRQMTTMYGIQTLLDILAGNRELLKTVTSGFFLLLT